MTEERIATHPDPAWRDRADFIIRINLSEFGMADAYEQLWTRHVSDDRYEMCCIPFFSYGIALGDIGRWSEERQTFTVEQRSGRRVIRFAFHDQSDADVSHEDIHRALEELGCRAEYRGAGYGAVDIETDDQSRSVVAILATYEKASRLSWEWAVE